jgi:hypothetical protein
MYYTFLQDFNIDGKNLSIPGLRDRAYIEIGFSLIGILDRSNKTSFIIDAKDNQDNSLIIFVENTGRLCFGNDLLDSKVF